MTSMRDQMELFKAPDPLPLPTRKRKVTVHSGSRYVKIKPKRRKLCDDCVQDIHDLGVAVAPRPVAASWKCISGDVLLLCNGHRRARATAGATK